MDVSASAFTTSRSEVDRAQRLTTRRLALALAVCALGAIPLSARAQVATTHAHPETDAVTAIRLIGSAQVRLRVRASGPQGGGAVGEVLAAASPALATVLGALPWPAGAHPGGGGAPGPGSLGPREVLVVVQPDQTHFLAALGVRGAGSGWVAATVEPLGGAPGSARIEVDAAAFGRLSARGREFVLAHEFTHLVLAGRPIAKSPLWLQEGLADLVATDGGSLTVAQVIAGALGPDTSGGATAASAAGAPDLPSDADFTAGGEREARAYARAWGAVRSIARKAGLNGVLNLGDQMGSLGTPGLVEPPAAALSASLGVSPDGFATGYRSELRSLAAAPQAAAELSPASPAGVTLVRGWPGFAEGPS